MTAGLDWRRDVAFIWDAKWPFPGFMEGRRLIWRVDGEEAWEASRQRSTAEEDSGVYNSGLILDLKPET